MAHSKENLQKLLEFLDKEIIHEPGNEWFVDKLRNLLPPQPVSKYDNSLLHKVEQYLGLDYKLDSATTIVDYSFIKDEYLKDCFEADCREMLRYRFGTRGHRIDFQEFCRFVQIQAERLLNLYYQSKGDISQIRSYIKNYNPTANGLDNCSSIESISFSIKLWAYSNEHQVRPLYNVLDKVRRVRNSQSHGSISESDEAFFQNHYAQLVAAGFPLLPSCLVNWNELSKNPQLKQKYEREYKDTKAHKDYIFLTWQRQYPFDEVTTALQVLALHVAQFI